MPNTKATAFCLRGDDPLAPSLIELWAACRAIEGDDQAAIEAVRVKVDTMRQSLYQSRKAERRILHSLPFDTLADELRRRGAIVDLPPSFDEPSGPIELDSLERKRTVDKANGHHVAPTVRKPEADKGD